MHEARSRLTKYVPGAYARHGDAGTRLHFTTIHMPELNTVSVDREWDPVEVEAFASELSATGIPWSIQARGEAGPRLVELGARHGRTVTRTLPLLCWDGGPPPEPPAPIPPGAAVREVSGAEAGVFATALTAGFGMPREFADIMSVPALFDAPDVAGFVFDLGGEAVATGLNVMIGDYVALFSGSVRPAHRRKGYYRALVMARLAHAITRGARYAVVQNTPMSRPLYEALGFRLAETWTYLKPAA
jgi:GNAT superfamily N-acetyltransferase